MCLFIPSRCMRNKPWVPKFRLLRGLQPFDGPLDINLAKKGLENETAQEFRKSMRRKGFLSPLIFDDRPLNVHCSSTVLDPYIPPISDGRSSSLSEKGKSYRAVLKIRSKDPNFNEGTFADYAKHIYINSHNLMENFTANEAELLNHVTEYAFLNMTTGMNLRTIRWKYVASIEPPQVVHVRTQEVLGRANLFAQVTVRMNSQQILAIYDRFGRLIYGNPNEPSDVMEYVVFEKLITDEYGVWRLHAKLHPPDVEPRSTFIPTQRQIEESSSGSQEIKTSNELTNNEQI